MLETLRFYFYHVHVQNTWFLFKYLFRLMHLIELNNIFYDFKCVLKYFNIFRKCYKNFCDSCWKFFFSERKFYPLKMNTIAWKQVKWIYWIWWTTTRFFLSFLNCNLLVCSLVSASLASTDSVIRIIIRD